jgi:hypothetical protein
MKYKYLLPMYRDVDAGVYIHYKSTYNLIYV